MDLLTRLEGSYTVQEQEAAEYIKNLNNIISTIRDLAQADLFGNACENIIKLIDGVYTDDYNQ